MPQEDLSLKEKHHPKLTSAAKTWIAVSLISLLCFSGYILRGSLEILFGYLSNVQGDITYVRFVGVAFWAGWVSLVSRITGLSLALGAIYLLWIKGWSFSRVKKLVFAALVLEGLNFLGLVPSIWFLLHPGTLSFPPSLGYGYIVQILFTVPFLWALAYQVAKYRSPSQRRRLLQFASLAFLGYTVALVANEVSRWTSMISIASITFLEGIRGVGFFNALGLMPFAVIFSIIGVYRVFRRDECSAMKWFGVSLIVIGLNYTIYLVFTYIVNSLNTLPLVDIWTIPLLGVGIALMLNADK